VTWGGGEGNVLGHGDELPKLVPTLVDHLKRREHGRLSFVWFWAFSVACNRIVALLALSLRESPKAHLLSASVCCTGSKSRPYAVALVSPWPSQVPPSL